VHTPQIGIFALGTSAHVYLEFDLPDPIKTGEFVSALSAIEPAQTTTGGLNLVLGLRPELWRRLAPGDSPEGEDSEYPEGVLMCIIMVCMSTMYSTGKAANYLGVSVKTLQRWDREGRLVPERTDSGRRMYSHAALDVFMRRPLKTSPRIAVAYCRVSSAAQKPDMKNQRRALEEFCAGRGLPNVELVQEIGGGMNLKRAGFVALMDRIEARQVSHLIIAHKDRLVRFGFPWFERFCAEHGTEILVLNSEQLSPEQEMVQDLLTIVQCFAARLYGLRNYRKKLKEALEQDLRQCANDPRPQ